MKEAGNAAIIAQLGREFGVSPPVDIFSEARRFVGRQRSRIDIEADYRSYLSGGEHILPDYVRQAAIDLLDVIPDSS